ncbi:MAG: YlxR family protein [Ruminococcaceae bacterium]|nr:YlxR family protein [Oscillospiraceae bacterium]
MNGEQKKQNSAAKQGAKQKKIPERRCVGCQGTFPKKELIRVVRSPEGEVSIDFTGKKSGRGAYVCKNEACLKKAKKTGVLHRHLEVEISEELYEELLREIRFELNQ